MKTQKCILSALALAFFLAGPLAAQHSRSTEFSLPSAILKKNIAVKVQLPEGYQTSKKKYAALYVVNGAEKSVEEMADVARDLHTENGTAEMIVVGIETSNDAALSCSFLEKELIPAIAKKYRANTDRTLLSKDYTGSLALYALLTKPGLFNGYISASRQWLEDGKVNYTDLAEKAMKSPAQFLGKKIYFARMNGAYDNGDPDKIEAQTRQFGEMLATKSDRRIAFQYKGFDDWGAPVHPDFKECLLFVSAAPVLQKFMMPDGRWVIGDSKKNILYDVWIFDNGPDYPSDGLFRIVKNGKIGYADEKTFAIVIPPQFDCAYPFENGKAKVSNRCTTVKMGEHSAWESDDWQFLDKKGKVLR